MSAHVDLSPKESKPALHAMKEQSPAASTGHFSKPHIFNICKQTGEEELMDGGPCLVLSVHFRASLYVLGSLCSRGVLLRLVAVAVAVAAAFRTRTLSSPRAVSRLWHCFALARQTTRRVPPYEITCRCVH